MCTFALLFSGIFEYLMACLSSDSMSFQESEKSTIIILASLS
uniref:Uncharacterized protein n=1 Tax=Syphacia muris TaxID=451379 RepID=A0A0N5AES8_9BILA